MKTLDEEWEEIVDKLRSRPDCHYCCPVCLEPMLTYEEKSQHLETVHGYDTLETLPDDPH